MKQAVGSLEILEQKSREMLKRRYKWQSLDITKKVRAYMHNIKKHQVVYMELTHLVAFFNYCFCYIFLFLKQKKFIFAINFFFKC